MGKMEKIDIPKLVAVQKKAQELKNGFKSTESKPWTMSSFSAELCFQVSHVACSILAMEGKEKVIFPLPGVNKGIEDEISDVLFNIMNFANYSNLSVADILAEYDPASLAELEGTSDLKIHVLNLTIQSGNLWDACFRNDGYKHTVLTAEENQKYIRKALAGILVSLLLFSKKTSVNVFSSFDDMYDDASKFLKNYKIKE